MRIIIIYWLDCGSDIKIYYYIQSKYVYFFLLIHFIFIYFCCCCDFSDIILSHILYINANVNCKLNIFICSQKRNWLFIQQQQQQKSVWKLLFHFHPIRNARLHTLTCYIYLLFNKKYFNSVPKTPKLYMFR